MGEVGNNKDIWVYVQIDDRGINSVVFELLGEGKRLAAQSGVNVCAMLIGEENSDYARELFCRGADKIYLAAHRLLKEYSTEGYTKAAAELIKEHKPDIVLFGGTEEGRDLAPRVAARLQAGLTVDCTELMISREDGRLRQIRPAFGSRLMAEIVSRGNGVQLCTVRPGMFKESYPEIVKIGSVVKKCMTLGAFEIHTKMLKSTCEVCRTASLSKAEIVVAGGKGIGSREGFLLLSELADVLHAAVGGTRAAVSEGFISHEKMIGQTGCVIAPRLYIACGISGAVQHMLGVSGADCIVAINNQADAPIFETADLGIKADYREFLPRLIEQVKKREG